MAVLRIRSLNTGDLENWGTEHDTLNPEGWLVIEINLHDGADESCCLRPDAVAHSHRWFTPRTRLR